MTSISKKLLTALLAVAAAVCLSFGLLFSVPKAASADTAETATLSAAEHFTISNGVLSGLSAAGKTEAGSKNIIIEIPESVTSVAAGTSSAGILGEYSARLTGLKVTGNVTSIGDYAFYGCTALSDLDMTGASKLETIGANAFNSGATGGNGTSALRSITVPESVTSIGNAAFAYHTNLTAINFNAVACADFNSGANNPFYRAGYRNTTSSSTETTGSSLTVTIGAAGGNAVTKIPANMFYVSGMDLKVNYLSFENVNIGADSFGENAFRANTSLLGVSFSDSCTITKIGDYAFSGCSVLSALGTIPASVNEIGNYAFSGCTSLTSVTFTDNSNLATIGDNAFASCPLNRISIPANVSKIGNNAFLSSSLTAVNFVGNSNLSSIGSNAFQNCSRLEKVYTGSEPASKSLFLPANVKSIGGYAFSGCTALEELTVPAGVETLGTYAFSGCTSVKTINYYAAAANPSSTATTSPFANGGSGITVNIGQTGGTTVTSIPSYLFRGTSLSSVNFSNVNFNITGFGTYVFYDCSTLTSVTFGNNCSVVKIPSHAFDGCTALSDITIPDGVAIIGEYAFYSCPSLYKINLPSSIGTLDGETAICENAFGGSTRVLEIKNLSGLSLEMGSADNGGIAQYAVNIYQNGDGNLDNVDGFIFMSGTTPYLVRYAGTETVLELPRYNNSYNYEIRSNAFMGNTNITEVTVPSGITRLGDSVFSGCTALERVTLPNTVFEMGNSVFNGCTALTSVTLPNVSNLGENLFNGCTKLETVVIPASVNTIGNSAFKGCTSLQTLTINGNSLRNIGTSAFQGCTSLAVVELPTPSSSSGSVSLAIGGYAFSGCTKLATVYLPATLTSYNVSYFENCASNLILIATDKASYETYQQSTLKDYNLTYVINIKLVYGDYTLDAPDTAVKLFGAAYTKYDMNDDKSWSYNENSAMPAQEGYETSVWYEDSGFTEEISPSAFASNLADPEWEAVMYAQVLKLPEVTARDGLSYTGSEGGFGATAIFGETFDTDKYTFIIKSYQLVSGSAGTLPSNNVIREAGTYKLQIQIADTKKYGKWLYNEDDLIEVYVSPSNYSLSDFWVTKSGGSLLPEDAITELYIYDGAPQLSRKSANDNAEIERVYASYLLYSSSLSEIIWNDSNANKPYTVRETTYQDNTGISIGCYTAQVTLEVDNNHTLSLASDSYMMARGVSLSPSAGSTYIVTKSWYIVTDGNISFITSNNTPYTISDWTYLLDAGETIPTAPRYNSSKENDNTAYSLIYTLTRKESESADIVQPVFSNRTLSDEEFGNYFNSSMPAGIYSLEVVVSDGVASPYRQTFTFTVKPADLSKILTMQGVGGRVDGWTVNENGTVTSHYLAGANYSVADDGLLHLDDGTPRIYITTLALEQINPREGYWALNEYRSYYSTCVVTYNVTRTIGDTSQNTTNYYPAGELAGTSIVPNTMGKYRIYYNISASNFKPLVDVTNSAERNSYSYVLSIYGELRLPTVSAKEYSGNPQIFDIQNEYYQVIRLDGVGSSSQTAVRITGLTYDYIDAGTHYLALLIQNAYTDVCRWASGVRLDDTGTYALLPVTVSPASNSVTTDLSIISWQWGSWNPEINSPVWKTQFGDSYTYELYNTETGRTVPFSQVRSEEGVDAGKYELIATVAEGRNWRAISQRVSFVILKATIYWDEAPYIESWKYGDFEKMYSPAEGKLNEAFEKLEIDVRYYTLDDYESGKPSADAPTSIEQMLDRYGELEADSYVLVYSIKGNNVNYNDWEYEVHFSVLSSDNYWTTSPVVQNWKYGEFATRGVDPTVVPRFEGTISYSYVKLRADGSPDSSPYPTLLELMKGLEGEDGKELPVGRYSLTVTVTGTKNYEMREPTVITFEVLKGDNSWVKIPSIISWSESRYSSESNYPVSEAAFGEAVYTILETDSDGNVINEYDITQIKSLGVGSYTLKAYVEGNDNYGELTAYATFAVFEDSIGMTGLIAATMVFAVIAVGLAVGGVILLVRRNKKIEEDFRKMVKSELHRR